MKIYKQAVNMFIQYVYVRYHSIKIALSCCLPLFFGGTVGLLSRIRVAETQIAIIGTIWDSRKFWSLAGARL